ncbi:NGFI-A-binding protein homolog isoform X2 [Teleopsis dalmanni]|uniref:NGFI-A-binding protein homolog isoform X2 n=1 Tax=Teleopsis dalmanni TaxID=139649 RepID=UPI0018CD4EC7|nr:NGFI-A-binding protein homolog isoform X2 [Teleopsis dalmanni]
MESVTGNSLCTTTTAATSTSTPTTVTATTSTISAAPTSAVNSSSNANTGNTTSVVMCSSNLSSSVANLPANPQILQVIDIKQDDSNNMSLASATSDGQRSLSGAPSASSSPILSPPGKIFGRNANGTMIATSRPSNEAEVQLYLVLQRASLLAYYDTLLEMGGDDVQQLYEAGEEEFLEIMALVGMASKPLHVRRLQKVLHEWANNPTQFQSAILSGSSSLCETPTKPINAYNPAEPSTSSLTRSQTSSTNLLTQMCTPAITVPVIQPHTPLSLPTTPTTHQTTGSTAHQVTSSSPQLTPVLTDVQVTHITLGAENIARKLPKREPRAQTSKKRTSRELEQVIAMQESDPRRMEEIRKYSAIYGRFDCKRRPEKPLTFHEVCVNEAAAQLCRLVPALLTRRDELFPLARQIVKDAGLGHSANISRYGGLLPQMQAQAANIQRSTVVVDCESSDSTVPIKRQRVSSTETKSSADLSRETTEDSRYNLFAMYQKFAKPPFDLTDIAKFSLSRTDYDDNDSRFSFSNSSSPSLPNNGMEIDREQNEQTKFCMDEAHSTASQTSTSTDVNRQSTPSKLSSNQTKFANRNTATECTTMNTSPLGGVQVISSAGGHIIAVANPALALSPTLNEALSLKRESDSPDL